MIHYTCSQCGAAMSSPDGLTAEAETCPKCGRSMAVPGASEPLAVEAARVTAISPKCPYCGHEMEAVWWHRCDRVTREIAMVLAIIFIIATIACVVLNAPGWAIFCLLLTAGCWQADHTEKALTCTGCGARFPRA